jgi:two-component system chemotaxis response regulator CheB
MNKIIVIGASSGGLNPLRRIIAALPIPCTASVFIVMHLGNHPSILPSVLAASTRLNVSFAQDGSPIQPGRIYVAPPDHHMLLELGRVRLNRGPKVHHTRPAISAAEIYGERVIGVVLSDGDGAEGLRSIKKHGGEALVQHPKDAAIPSMPKAAIVMDHPDACSVEEIAKRVKSCR